MANRFWVGGSGTWDNATTTHWSATTGGSGGASVPGAADAAVFDASSGGGTVKPNYNLSIISITMGAFTGTLDFSANNNSPTLHSFSGTGTGTRTLNMGSGTWTLTGNNVGVWDFTTATNLTFSAGTSTINCTYSGSSGTRTVTTNTAAPNILKVSAGTDTVSLPSTFRCGDLDFTGFTGTLSAGLATVSGNLTFGFGMTVNTSASAWTFSATTSVNLTSNSVQNNRPYTFDGVGGYWNLKDNLDLGGASLRALTLTNGTIDAVDGGISHDVTCGSFSSSNANVRALLLGSGTWTLTGTGTVWTAATATNLTLTAGTATVKVTDSSNTAATFSGGGMTYYNIWWARGASSASNTVAGSNTFNDFKDDGTVAHSVLFTAATTQHYSSWTVSGHSGNLITLNSTTTGTYAFVKDSAGRVSVDYLNIQHCVATPAATWYAGANSVNNQGTATSGSGWAFTVPPVSGQYFGDTAIKADTLVESTSGTGTTFTTKVYVPTPGSSTEAVTKAYVDALSFQPLDSDLTTIAGLTATTDNFLVAVASAWASRTPSQVRTTLALVIGTNVQAWDADLDTWATKTAPSGTVIGTTDTQTLTNKRVNPRVSTTASSATPTPNADTDDEYTVTALAAGATFGAPTGTPVEGQKLIIRVKDNGSSQTLAYNGVYRFSSDLAAPTATVISKTLYLGFIYNFTDTRWDCVAILNNF